jgi:hypothetical protein
MLSLVAGTVPLLGCGATHLYNRGEHQLATKAGETFAAAALDKSLAGEQAQLDALMEQEVAMVRRQSMARRDAALLAIVAQPSAAAQASALLEAARQRRECLIGNADLDELQNRITELDTVAKTLDADATDLRLTIGFKPVCPVDRGQAATLDPGGTVLFDAYAESCDKFLAARAGVSALAGRGRCVVQLDGDTIDVPSPSYGDVLADLNAAEDLQAEISSRIEQQRAAVEAAQRAYEDAVKRGEQATTVETLAGQLDAALDALGTVNAVVGKNADGLGLQDLNLEARIAQIEVQRAALQKLLAEVSTSESGTAEDNGDVAMTIARSLPIFERGARNAFDPTTPTPLLLELGRLQVELESLQRRVGVAKRQIELLALQRALIEAELGDLQKAIAVGEQVRSCGGVGCVPLSNGILAFAASDTYSRVEQDVVRRQRTLLRHQAALNDSELALLGWHRLIGTAIDQLIGYHASGIKPETIAALLQAAGVGAIAGGVN